VTRCTASVTVPVAHHQCFRTFCYSYTTLLDSRHFAPPMAGKPLPTDLSIYTFPDASALESFLASNHATMPGCYVKFAKKASGIQSVTKAEATEVALCFGWIDGVGQGLDANWYLGRFTPRRAKSLWSQKNVETVGRLIAEGRMQPAGHAAVEAAKADGRWDRAYAGPATITVPADFEAALKKTRAAGRFFATLNSSERYAVLWRVHTATPTARPGRMEALVEMLAEGKKPGALGGKKASPHTGKVVKAQSRKKAVAKEATVRTEAGGQAPRAADGLRTSVPRRPGLRPRSR
jgi:uncharacterized protein YdeI (YjbR/CyaY-like superfamily)